MGRKKLLKERDVQSEYGIGIQKLRRDRRAGVGLPHVRLGRAVYYERKELEAFIRASSIPTEDSTELL